MSEFFKKLFAERNAETTVRRPQGRFGVTGKVAMGRGKSFTFVREDILQKAISASRKEAA